MKIRLPLLAAALVLGIVACGDDSGTSKTGTNTSSSVSPATAPADYLRGAVNAQQAAVKTVDTTSIQKAIQMFNVDEGRNPKDLNELVEKKYLPKLPDPPAGMKLVYDAQAGSVKIVRQ